jgi:transposase-like protein
MSDVQQQDFPLSWLERLHSEKVRLENRNADVWVPILERAKGVVDHDGIERVTAQSLLDILKVPMGKRKNEHYQRLTKIMIDLGWSSHRIHGITAGGYREQVHGFCRDARHKKPPTADEKRRAELGVRQVRRPKIGWPEFKRQVVEMVRSGKHPAELADQFQIPKQTIRNWVDRHNYLNPEAPVAMPQHKRGPAPYNPNPLDIPASMRVAPAAPVSAPPAEKPSPPPPPEAAEKPAKPPAPFELPDIPAFLRREK